jgi:hypothetical protein
MELLEVDNRIASLEVTREVLIPQLKEAYKELDNNIVETRSLGCKVYELRTETVPKMEKRMKLIEQVLMGVGILNCLVALYFAARYYYG